MLKYLRSKFIVFTLLFVLIVFGGLSYQTTIQMLNNNSCVQHTLDVMSQTSKVQSSFFEYDGIFLRYIISNEERFKLEFEQTARNTHNEIEQLQILIIDNDYQVKRCKELLQSLDKKLEFQKNIIENKNKINATSVENNQLRMKVVEVLEKISEEETRLLVIRQNDCEKTIIFLAFILGFGSLFITFLAFWVGHYYSELSKQQSLDRFVEKIKGK